MKSALTIHEKKENEKILIIDKKGEIGEPLALNLSKDFQVALVTRKQIEETKRLRVFAFTKKFPQVPDFSYSKIYLVDDGSRETREATESLISKARETEAPVFFIGNIRLTPDDVSENQATYYTKAKSLITGDIFSDSVDPNENTVQRYIYESRKRGRIDVVGDGLAINFPVSLNDTIELILKATYLDFSENIILLFSPQPITDLSLAHLFQKADPQISIDFKKGSEEKNLFVHPKALHVISTYDLLKEIKNLSLEDREIKIKTPGLVRKPSRAFRLVMVCIVFILLLPFLSTALYAGLGITQLNSSRASLEKGKINDSLNSAKNSKTFFDIASKTSRSLEYEASFIGQKERVVNLRRKIDSGSQISIALSTGLSGIQNLMNVYSGKSTDPKGDFAKTSYSLKTSVALLQEVKASGNLPKDIEQRLNDLSPLIDLTINTSDILPELLGFEKERNYLILFQNNLKIRPGGGLIESYGVLTLKDGRIKNFKVYDVAEADKKLIDHIEPPYALRRFVPTTQWYLKDSNFHPDFVKSAISASSIYSLETKKQVDGVIGTDLNFAKNIVSEIGALKVDGKSVNKNNIFDVATDTDLFLGSFAKAFEKEMSAREYVPFLSLATATGKSLKEKDLLLAFQEGASQDVFTANGWSSSLWDQRVLDEGKIIDYLGVVDANLGKSSNYEVTKSVSKKVKINETGEVTTDITVAYRNKGREDYKNYVQLVVPQGGVVQSVSINEKQVEVKKAITDFYLYEQKGFRPPTGLEVDEKEELGKKIVGFLINIPKEENVKVVVSVSLPYALDIKSPDLSYSLKYFKQPGTLPYTFSLSFDLPENLKIIENRSLPAKVTTDIDYNILIGQK